MAQGVLALLSENPDYELAGVVSRSEPVDADGTRLTGFNWFASLQEFDAQADLLIDFTLPGGTESAARWCGKNGVALLSGTTGLSDSDTIALQEASRVVAVLWAPNLSVGIALLTNLLRQTASVLGPDADITISDIHHKYKQDAPSGTALALATAITEGMPDNQETELGFISVREGEVVGDHTINFELPGEIIEISHKALDRGMFAAGALRAGKWLVNQAPGYYSTKNWLSL